MDIKKEEFTQLIFAHLTCTDLQLHNYHYPYSKIHNKKLHEKYCVHVTEENNKND
jgi:hypothetical protein